jgi:hypothetical protein
MSGGDFVLRPKRAPQCVPAASLRRAIALISMPNRLSAAARPVVALGVRSAIAAVF